MTPRPGPAVTGTTTLTSQATRPRRHTLPMRTAAPSPTPGPGRCAVVGSGRERIILTDAEVGKAMTVEASYTDGHGTEKRDQLKRRAIGT